MKVATLLFLYNRPAHTKKTLQSIISNNCRDVFIFLDGPRDIIDGQKQDEIRKVIESSDLKYELVERDENIGLASSIRAGIEYVFNNNFDAAIVVEDDCRLHESAYAFFTEALRRFWRDTQVRSVCGYVIDSKSLITGGADDLVLLKRFNTWGWATWKNRWADYTGSLETWASRAAVEGYDIQSESEDLAAYCSSERYLNGDVDIWSMEWICLHFSTNTYCIYPKVSLVYNDGFDGSGVNCTDAGVFVDSSITEYEVKNWNKPQYYYQNDEAIEKFMLKNSQKIYPEV